MSQLAYIMSGSKTRVQSLQAGETMATAGVPVIGMVANNDGIMLGGVATSVDAVGMTLDTATHATAQTATNTDPAAYVSVVTNADAVWQSRLSGTAASGGALVQYFNTIQSTNGLVVTPSLTSGGAAVDCTAINDMVTFGYSGANAGILRRNEIDDATNVDHIVAFPFDIEVDDLFIFCAISTACGIQAPRWTTTLDEMENMVTTTAVTAATWHAVDYVLNDIGNNGVLNSYVNVICADHIYAGQSLGA